MAAQSHTVEELQQLLAVTQAPCITHASATHKNKFAAMLHYAPCFEDVCWTTGTARRNLSHSTILKWLPTRGQRIPDGHGTEAGRAPKMAGKRW